MLSAIRLTVTLLFASTASDWHLPPLVAGRTVALQLAARDPVFEDCGPHRVFRYNALWDVTLRIQVWTDDDMGLFLLATKPDGERVADDEGKGSAACHLEVRLTQGDVLHVAVGTTSPDEVGSLSIAMQETPDFASWLAHKKLFVPPPASSKVVEVAAKARELLQQVQVAIDRGELEASRSLSRQALERLSQSMECDDDPSANQIRDRIGDLAARTGDLATATEARRKVVAFYEKTLSEDRRELLVARAQLGHDSGDPSERLSIAEGVLRMFERVCAEDAADLLTARHDMANALKDLGHFDGACALLETVVAARERKLSHDDPDLQLARLALGSALAETHNYAAADALYEKVEEVYARSVPADNYNSMLLQVCRGAVKRDLGDIEWGRRILEGVIPRLERALTEQHPLLARARDNLAAVFCDLGDYAAEESLLQRAANTLSLTSPAGSILVQQTLANLAGARAAQGDLTSARLLLERSTSELERTLPGEHATLQLTRANLAAVFSRLGQHEAAKRLEEQVVVAHEKTLGPNDKDLQRARGNLAITLARLGDLDRAKLLCEQSIEGSKGLPMDHPWARNSLGCCAWICYLRGELVEARSCAERVLESWEHAIGPDANSARQALCWILAKLDDQASLTRLLRDLANGMETQLEIAARLSRREQIEANASLEEGLSTLLSLGSAIPEVSARAFAIAETIRAGSANAERISTANSDDAVLASLRRAAFAAKVRVTDVLSGAPGVAREFDPQKQLIDAVTERDRAESALNEELVKRGSALPTITVNDVAHALRGSAAVVAYRRVRLGTAQNQRVDSLVAHIVKPDGSLVRIDLGPIAPIEDAVQEWRAAIGKPLARAASPETDASPRSPSARVLRPQNAGDQDLNALGDRVRMLIVDPVLAATGNVHTIHVCLDDVLHLVPIDALPFGKDCLGNVRDVRFLTSFRQLTRPRTPLESPPIMLAIGAINFDAEPESTVVPSTRDCASPPVALDRTALVEQAFFPLLETVHEIDGIGDLFRKQFATDAMVVKGQRADKRAFLDRAPAARFIHIATHGYFADQTFKSWSELSTDRLAGSSMSGFDVVQGLAPMTLCGLALAGANRGPDSLGHVNGIITAEEISGLNLDRCELAVLSACETSVGIRRAGQGIQSLQAALHLAGVRSAVTSLWRVDDRTTRDLMVDFYRRLWMEKKPKAQALWEAKMAVRAQGSSLRDWSGWILTGDPN